MIFPILLVQGLTGIFFSATEVTLLAFFITFFLGGPDLTADVTSNNEHGSDRNVACDGGKRDLKIEEASVLDAGLTCFFLTTFFEGLLNLTSAKQSRLILPSC